MALSRIGGALLHYCLTLTQDCACCCKEIDIFCAGDPPTITVFGETFALDVFGAQFVGEIPYWRASDTLTSGAVQLHGAALRRAFGFCVSGDQFSTSPVEYAGDKACSYRYLLRDIGTVNIYAVEFEDATLAVQKNISYLNVRANGVFWQNEWSGRFTAIGGHNWKMTAAVNPNPYSTTAYLFPPEGSTEWQFSDGAEAQCLP